MSKERKSFTELSQIDVSNYIKQKEGGKNKDTGEIVYLNYLSWASAHKLMKQIDNDAEVIEHEFEHYHVLSGVANDYLITEKKPYRRTGNGFMVKVSVVMFGNAETENLAILNYKNQPVLQEPTSSEINKALKRAFVKALAKHGIALYLYEGEDIPEQPKIDVKEIEKLEAVLTSINEKTGKDNKKILINTVNKYTENDPRLGKKIKEISDMTYDQAGLFKIALTKISNEFDKANKK